MAQLPCLYIPQKVREPASVEFDVYHRKKPALTSAFPRTDRDMFRGEGGFVSFSSSPSSSSTTTAASTMGSRPTFDTTRQWPDDLPEGAKRTRARPQNSGRA